MSLPSSNGIFIHNGINCSPAVVPTAQSIPMSPSDPTTVKTVVDNKSDLSIIADEYDTSATYTLGDFVIYDKVLYKCITYSTTGAWDSTRWVAVNSKDSGINLKNSSGNTLVKVLENTSGDGVVSLYDKTTGYETISMHSYGDIDAKSITVMTSGYSNSGRIELTTTQSNSGYISLRDNYKNTPIELNADDGNINAISLNGVTIGSSPKFTDTTYESKTASSGGTDLSLVTTGEKYTWNNKASTNTTYTFTNGTNGFTVTPSGGSAQTVTVTPSITNNVTGSGTSGYIAKFNSANTITNGPAFGSSTSTYLRNDGSWATPPNTTYSLGTRSDAIVLTASTGGADAITVPYATKAATWNTARNLTVGNTAKSVNGSADVSWPNPLKIGFCGSDSANTSGWYRVMTVSQSGYSDTNLNLLLTSGYSKNASGILHLHVRCNNGTANSLQSLCWLSRYGWSIGDVYYKDHGNNTWSLYVYQANTQYGRVQIQVLTETNTTTGQLNITMLNNGTRESSLSGGTASWEGAIDLSSSLSVSGNLQSVTKKFFDHNGVVELFMTGSVKTAIADNGVFLTVPSGYNPKVNDSGFTFFTGSDQYIPTGMRFGYFTWGGRDFHTLGALGVGTQVTVHITYLI